MPYADSLGTYCAIRFPLVLLLLVLVWSRPPLIAHSGRILSHLSYLLFAIPGQLFPVLVRSFVVIVVIELPFLLICLCPLLPFLLGSLGSVGS